MRGLGPFLKDAWRLSRPYFMASEERWAALGLLVAIIALRLSNVGIGVVLSFWRKEFYNALEDKDFGAFVELLLYWRNSADGFTPGFTPTVLLYVAIAVYAFYLNQLLQIRWRRWLTRHYLTEWMSDRAYYHISLNADREALGTDNPDQRVAEDLRDFTRDTLRLGVDLLSNVVNLASFVGILWGLSGDMTVFGVAIPGYMVWVALIYAIGGTWLTHKIGSALVPLNFRQQRVEADFRYALVRVRENVEGIALYRGEGIEIFRHHSP
jgi:putative ATP-binding cassette transporter